MFRWALFLGRHKSIAGVDIRFAVKLHKYSVFMLSVFKLKNVGAKKELILTKRCQKRVDMRYLLFPP